MFNLPKTNNPSATLDAYLLRLTPEEFTSQADEAMEYEWTKEDIDYAALLVQTEAGGMGEDAQLSILSTVYGRFTSPAWCSRGYCSKSVYEEMVRPNQFIGPEVAIRMRGKGAYDRIRPQSYLVVYKFILGFRGSCSGDGGFEYFNSYPGGPSTCKIVDESNGQFVEFSSTPRYETEKAEGHYRNVQRPDINVIVWYHAPVKSEFLCYPAARSYTPRNTFTSLAN
jgi:hypothetical protein